MLGGERPRVACRPRNPSQKSSTRALRTSLVVWKSGDIEAEVRFDREFLLYVLQAIDM